MPIKTQRSAGAFSSAPNTRKPAELVAKPENAAKDFSLMKAGLGVHNHLKENKIPHLWHVCSGPRSIDVRRKDLSHFSQKLFR